MEVMLKFFCASIVALFAAFVLGFSGCTTFDSNSDSAGNVRTNTVSVSTKPVYQVETPTMVELAGNYRSQDKTFHDSVIQIFPDGEFVWNSRTTTLQIFRGHIYDLNNDGFSVKLSDGSGDSFHFKFIPDKRGFWSLDENGGTVEEYLR